MAHKASTVAFNPLRLDLVGMTTLMRNRSTDVWFKRNVGCFFDASP